MGERVPAQSEVNPLDELPAYEQENWLDMADALLKIAGLYPEDERVGAMIALMRDWQRYGEVLARDPEHRDSMRRAVVIEARVLLDRMWVEAGGDR